MKRILFLPFLLLLVSAGTLLAESLPVPHLMGPVTDQAGLLTQQEMATLEQELTTYEDSTSNQFVVLIIPSLQGESLEDYSIRVAQENKIGTAKNDNGMLMLIAVQEHKIRIEVGYGLEGVLTDAMTATIRENEITPKFRRGDYYGGIESGLKSLMQAAAGEYKAERKGSEDGADGIGVFIVIVIILIVAFVIKANQKGPRGPGGRGGGGSGILPWLIASQLASRGHRSSRGSGGGWSGGGFGGGGFGGGGGGGWSGGGGSFGGGGSSGGW